MESLDSSFLSTGPQLRIDTSNVTSAVAEIDTPRARHGRARTISQAVLPAFLAPSSPNPEISLTAQLVGSHLEKQPPRNESRKLLAHILGELDKRPRAPPIFDTLERNGSEKDKGIDTVVLNTRDVVNSRLAKDKGHASRTVSQTSGDLGSDDEDDSEIHFSTDTTFELMNQLKDLLLKSQGLKWKIFDDRVFDNDGHEFDEKSSAAFRFRRSSFQPGRRSRSPSPLPGSRHEPGLLARCITVLASVVADDCRFQFSAPKPSRPPNALQALSIDIAQFLVHYNQRNPRIINEIGIAMVSAFSSFPAEMQGRLLAFFEESVLRGMLDKLKHLQGATGALPSLDKTDQEVHSGSQPPQQPIVAIQIEEPQEDSDLYFQLRQGWKQWSPIGPQSKLHVKSTRAPKHPLGVYYLSTLVPPLLAAILDNVDLASPIIPRVHRAYMLFRLVVEAKPDAYLDVLQIVAYHTTRARHSAITLLSTFWPKALGHIVIGKPIPSFSFVESLQQSGLVKASTPQAHHYDHQFVPWRFTQHSTPAAFDGFSLSDCRSCSKRITGFGLLCPFCMCAVHFDCYDAPEGSFLSHYPVLNEPNTEKVAVHRFSYIVPQRRDTAVEVILKHQHAFRAVNVFTLSLCVICHRPLWGCMAQGLRCRGCNHFVHSACLDNRQSDLLRCQELAPDSADITITWESLRKSFADHYRGIFFTEEELGKRTHEEMCIIWSTLWIQMYILRNGIASGSIVVIQKAPKTAGARDHGIDDFELQYLVKLYEAYLQSGRLPLSHTLEEFMRENGLPPRNPSMVFHWPTLVYITSVVKTPLSTVRNDNGPTDLLNVSTPAQPSDDVGGEDVSHPFEDVSLAHVRDSLGLEFQLYHNEAAFLMIHHLHHIGFLDSPGLNAGVLIDSRESMEIRCSFPIPLGIDLSSDVETLVVAAEACLLDLDVSINEVGFLLLVRKLWPSGMASEYALTRLARTVMAWILNEDESLMTILRDYVARGRSLPGVPSGLELHSWPTGVASRAVATTSVNNGGDYVACRKSLLTRYAAPWLLALHDQDINIYSSLLFDLAVDIAAEVDVPNCVESFLDLNASEHRAKERRLVWADRALRYILKLCQTGVAFTAIDDVLPKFLDSVSDLTLCHKPLTTLPRLFNREIDISQRLTMVGDTTIGSIETMGMPSIDPWRVVMDEASKSLEGLQKSLKWFCLLASSGVDIPVSYFLQISALARDFSSPFEDHALLVECALFSAWMKSNGRQNLQAMLSELHTRQSAWILDQWRRGQRLHDIHRFIRQSLATCLLLYGCERPNLLASGMVDEQETHDLPSRRKSTKRTSLQADPIIIDVDLIDALARYANEADDNVCSLIAKFLTSLCTEAKLMEPYEIDNFILRNSMFLSSCAWRFYDIDLPELNALRPALLLRILVVDVQTFETLLHERFHPDVNWESRLQSAARLFRVILDVTSPSFAVEGRQWRSCVIDVFYHYFTCIWEDEREEVRLATDTWAQTLQPAHFEAITLCWNEALSKSPIPDRVKLVSFLLQLRPHFPAWKVLSWDVVVETLLDDEFTQNHRGQDGGPAASHLSMYGISDPNAQLDSSIVQDPDMAVLQGSLLLLSLYMIADGIPIDLFSLLKIKSYLAIHFGFADVTLVPLANGHSFYVHYGGLGQVSELSLTCIDGLMVLLDAFHHLDLPPSAMVGTETDTATRLLVGAIMIDVILNLFNQVADLTALPFLTTKAMLQCLAIVIYKHDLESKPLRHLRDSLRKAVRRATDLLILDVSYELRQLSLSICQAYLKRWPLHAANILLHQLQSVIGLISSLRLNGEDMLVAQATSFVEITLSQYASSGLFYQLCKRKLDEDFFRVIRHIVHSNTRTHTSQAFLRESLLRDTLTQILSQPNDPTQQVAIENVKTYVDMVYHQGYTSDLMQFVGRCLASITRNASEMTFDGFDPNPILLMISTLIQFNKAQSREILGYTDTLLRTALVRFDVDTHSLKKLLHASLTLYRKSGGPDPGIPARPAQLSSLASTSVEVLSDALRGKVRVTAFTLKAMVEVLSSPYNGKLELLSTKELVALASDGFTFLQTSHQPELTAQRDFAASLAVASLVLRAIDFDIGFFTRHLHEQASDKTGKPPLTVRSWNLLALSAIRHTSGKPAATLFVHLSVFSATYYSSLHMAHHANGLTLDLSAVDVNHAFVAIKLWLLLARKCCQRQQPSDGFLDGNERNEDSDARMVWNELWPAFDRLVTLSESDAEGGVVTPIAALIWSSVADVFLFLRQTRSILALETSGHISTLNRVRSLGRGESVLGKFARAVNSMSEPPPEVALDVLAGQAAQDIMAAEKLHALEVSREVSRNHPEKNRGGLRTVSV